MSYNYKDFDYAAYVSKNQKQLNELANQKNALQGQINNFDKTYDYTKDAGWIAADKQIKSDANVLASQERGRMGNRIGAKTSWEDAVSASIQTEAAKNSQNLIPTYKEAAYNKLLNQQNRLDTQYNNLLQQERQDYSDYLAGRNTAFNEHVTKENYNYKNYLENQEAIKQAEAAKNPSIDPDLFLKFKQFDADNGTNYAEQFFGVTPNTTEKSLIDTTGASAAAKAFPKVIFSKEMFDNSSNTKKEYGTYQNYVQQQIMKGYQKGNLSVSDVNWLKRYYGF